MRVAAIFAGHHAVEPSVMSWWRKAQLAPDEPPRLLVAVTDAQSLLLVRGQLAAARAAGFDVMVLSSPGKIADAVVAKEGVTHIPIAMERAIAPLSDLGSLLRILAAVSIIRPHIINAGTPKAGLLVIIAGFLTGVPCRIHTLRGLRFETLRGPKKLLLAALTRLTCSLSHRVICISPSLRDRAIELGIAPAGKTVVLGAGSSNGLDIERFSSTPSRRARAQALRHQLGIDKHCLVFGFAGRIARDKGVGELCHAFVELAARHADIHLLVVGAHDPSDPIPEPVAATLREHPRIHCPGHMRDMAVAYLAMDVLVLPTYREGFGNVLLEAAALERPVIASAVTGCVDAVGDGINGTLVKVRDSRALARAMARYLGDDMLRARHGHAGRERVLRMFRQEDLWTLLHREYARLLSSHGLLDSDREREREQTT